MPRRAHPVIILLVVLLCLAPGAPAQDSVATDKAALTALYNATDGANWTPNTNWATDQPLSSWHGVTTNSDGRVTRLELDGNGLDGTLPAALGDLSALEQLDLQNNALSGALPDELANLTNLTSLLLNESRALTGPLPDGLRELSGLETVNIEKTELCAPDGDAFQTWLATITFSGLICPPAEQSVIDVAVFYTSAARENTGGTDEIATVIDLMVAETNMAYENSGANQRINLVAAEEVVGYRETNDLAIDIARLRSPSDGYMDEVHGIRDTVAADIVLLLVGGSSGRAYQLHVSSTSSESSAFGVVNAYSTYTFAHELGHIMGLHHDRYQVCGDNCNNFTRFPYAFGYVNQRALEPSPPDTAFWRTIMAYTNQCGRCSPILRFSNPGHIYPDPGGDPLGKAGLDPAPGADGPSDAVRMLNRTRGYVANYRSAPEITVSFDAETYTATEGGTTATVTVSLSDAPGRAIDIPVTASSSTGAAASDYTVPASVAFAANETQKTFTFTAVDDAVDDDDETVTLTLGYLLPGGVSAGSPSTATVTLTDNDLDPGAPSILSVWLSSDPGGGYAEGEEIEASVRFDKTVTVTGSPQLGLTVGSVTRQASYEGGAREVVTFSYEVADDETDADGVSIAANALSPNGGTIRDSANRAAGLTHSALADDANHRVDGVAPMLLEAVVDGTILTLTYDEPLAQPAPRASAFFTVAVTHPGSGRYAPEIVVDGSVMTVTLWDPVLAGEEVTVKFSNISVFGTPHLIRDLAGNPAASLREHEVTNVTEERHYDTDGDGLIEITTLAQLDAVRHDRNGDGVPTAAGASTYRAAFPDAFPEADSQLRCVLECDGYELMADLDFDTDDDGDVDSDDAYWNNGAGWDPIGRSGADFLTTFEGNGHAVRNLFINRPSTNYAGLFGYTDWAAKIRHVGLIQADVAGRTHVGGLVGNNLGTITACYATGQVSGSTNIGGLVGSNYSSVRTSYAAAQVSGRSAVGGLVGRNLGIIIDASYATGAVSGQSAVGGLVGYEDGNTIRASYATGRVSGETSVGGLVGGLGSSTITASYWDTTTSGQTTGDHGTGQTAAQLQAPTDDTGIYADWDDDLWDFGEADEYPVLVVDFDGNGDATWEEFGYQLREGPDLTATFEPTGVTLTWTEVDADHWDPAPDVAYTLYRDDGTSVTTLAENASGRSYTDTGTVVGGTYAYQVAAVVDGGEATRSARVSVTVPDSTPPTVSMIAISSNPGTDATYAAGDEIQVTVTFSETVEVTGTPQLTLELGGGRRTATYGGGSGTAALLFAYEVADGESDTDGVGVEADSLLGGTIRDGSNNNAVLDHDGLAADSGHKVDGVKPQLAATGGAVVDGTRLTLTYDEALDGGSRPVSGDFTVSGGDQTRMVSRVSVSGSTVLLTLDVGAEHLEAGIQVSYTPGANPIQDVPGNDAEALSRETVNNETPDTTSPEVSSLAIISNPGADQIYAAGDEIEVTVRFDETVEVDGTPQLRLKVGTRTRTAGYDSGTGTDALVFVYEVAVGDEDTVGVSIEAGRIALNGGTIEDEAENAAVLDHEAVAPQAVHKVDGVRPVFLSAAVDGASMTLTYGEALDPGSRPAPGDFTVQVDGSGRNVSGVSVSGSVVTLTLNPAVEHGDTGIRVSYTPDTNPIRDAVGNDALGLSSRSVTNTTGAPNTAPEITSPSSFDVRENQMLVRRLAARDSDPGDEVTGWTIVGGADQGQFTITSDTGDLSFRTAPDFEGPGDNEYEVTVEVRSGAGARELEAEQTFTLRVTDEREPPDIPEAPSFSGETAESMTVSWSEPDNTGPAITDYDLQYREKGTGRFSDGQHEGPGLSLTLDDLEPGTVYEVQVRATNDEGTSNWSESGEGMTITPLRVEMTSGTEPPVEGPFTVRFSFSETVRGFSSSDIETQQEPACTDSTNNPVFCNPSFAALQTTDDRIFTTTVTPRTERVAHNYTLTITVPANTVTSDVGNKPNEAAALEVRIAPPGVTVPISSIGLRANSGNGQVTLRWSTPSNSGGAAIVRYEYRWGESGGEFSDWMSVGSSARSATVPNLTNGTEYVFEVRGVNALGYGSVETAMATPEEGGVIIFPPPPPPTGNKSPTADAGPDQLGVWEGALVTLDGSGSSDPDGDTLRFRWNQYSGEPVVLSSRDVANPTFTAPEGLTADAVLSFRLLVTDPSGHFDSDTVTVTVDPEAEPPPPEDGIYYFPHLAVGAGWQTTLTYINYSPQEVSCQTDFLSDLGTPLMVSFADQGTVISRPDVLKPGESVHQETNVAVSAPPVAGWSRATCTGPVKASLLYRRFEGGVPTGEAGVNATTVPATRFVTFAEQGEGKPGTGVAYANPSDTETVITFTALDADGLTLASVNQELSAGGHGAKNMVDLFDLSSFTGSLEVTSTQPIVTLSLNNEADPIFSSLPPGELDAAAQGSTTYYFPHLAVGDGWQTTITYINYSLQEVTCQTEFLSDHGSPLLVSFAELGTVVSRPDVLPPGGSVHEETNVELSAPPVAGWARATCSGPVKASLLYRRFEGGVPTGEAGVNAVTVPATRFVTFAEKGEGQHGTGVAYANPSDTTTAFVTFTVRDADGQMLDRSAPQTLLPRGHDAKNMVDLFGLSSFTGSLEVTSTAPIVSLSLNNEAAPVFSSLPPGEVD